MAEPERNDDNVLRTTVDGVAVFWTPSAPRTMVSLQFRAGRSDEPFPRMGTSHLVEHLALFPIGRRPYATNGFVDHLRTVFHATGTVEEVTGFIRDVIANLRSLPLATADTFRVLYGRDGFSIRVDPAEWRNGAKAVAAIDRAIPPELVVPTEPNP